MRPPNATNQDSYSVPVVSVRLVRSGTLPYKETVNSAYGIVKMVFPLFKGLDREHLVVVGLTAKLVPTIINTASMGVLDAAPVHPREVLKPLILSNSYTFIILHNHVTGDVTPSVSDRAATGMLQKAGKCLQIELLDHIIVGCSESSFLSFKNAGLLKSIPNPVS
jgi:DNA repair protein RadC